jgi:hypothetical protein
MEGTLNRRMRKNWDEFVPPNAASMPDDLTTTLADELYALATDAGATPAAIREMPALMGLTYIRAEAPAADEAARDEAVAATVRNFIEQATYALEEPVSQREDKDADRGAAARCLLGLQPGTGAMLLPERRTRAAGYLVKHVRTLTKPRKVKGRMVSHETALMAQLASELWDREADFLRDNDHGDGASSAKALLLETVSDVWKTASELGSNIDMCVGGLRPQPGETYMASSDYASLELLARLWQLVRIPPENDPFLTDLDQPSAVLNTIFPEGLVALLFVLPPFDRATTERLRKEDLILTPEIVSPDIVHELMPQWHDWLDSCQCNPLEPENSCSVHRFQEALDSYIKQLDKCWTELRDPHRTPISYKSRRTHPETLEYYAIRSPY